MFTAFYSLSKVEFAMITKPVSWLSRQQSVIFSASEDVRGRTMLGWVGIITSYVKKDVFMIRSFWFICPLSQNADGFILKMERKWFLKSPHTWTHLEQLSTLSESHHLSWVSTKRKLAFLQFFSWRSFLLSEKLRIKPELVVPLPFQAFCPNL